MDLREVHEELVPAIDEELLFVAAYSSVEDVGEACIRLSEYFQALAICHLLEEGNAERFQENLVRSAYARRFFLQRCREQGKNSGKYLGLGRSEAVLDAIASGRVDLAGDIAALSTELWDAKWEYEDDFCFFLLVHLFLLDPSQAGKATRAEVISRFETALEGAGSARLEVCRALNSGDAEKFSSALSALMSEKMERSDEERRRIISHDLPAILFWPRSYVSIEGLALLALANTLEMPIENDFPLCPGIGKLPLTTRDYMDVVTEVYHLGLAERR